MGTTIGETVGRLPGVTTSGFTAGASRPVIRAQDAFRTDVLEGGLSTQDVSRQSPDHAVPVSPIGAQRIEIVRGPGVLRYGGGASAGVVNALTNRIPQGPIEEAFRGELLGFGQYNGDAATSAVASRVASAASPGTSTASTARPRPTAPASATSSRATETETGSFTAGGAYTGEVGRLGFSYTRYDSSYGIRKTSPSASRCDQPLPLRGRLERTREGPP